MLQLVSGSIGVIVTVSDSGGDRMKKVTGIHEVSTLVDISGGNEDEYSIRLIPVDIEL